MSLIVEELHQNQLDTLFVSRTDWVLFHFEFKFLAKAVVSKIQACTRTQSYTHFRHPTDEQLQHSYIFSNYYNLQSVLFEYIVLNS